MKRLNLAAVAALLFAWIGSVHAADPVHITYGYHPYWTGGWNGVIIKHKKLHEKYLPAGSTVKFEAHLTGPPMVNALLADKMQVGTMGDMPSLVATTKRKIADIRLVSTPMFSNGQNCNKIVGAGRRPRLRERGGGRRVAQREAVRGAPRHLRQPLRRRGDLQGSVQSLEAAQHDHRGHHQQPGGRQARGAAPPCGSRTHGGSSKRAMRSTSPPGRRGARPMRTSR